MHRSQQTDALAGVGGELSVSSDEPAQEHELFADQILDAMHDAVVVTDTDLDEPGPRMTYVNAAFTAMTGWQPHEVLGRSPRMLQAEGVDRDQLRRAREAMAAGNAVRFEVLNKRKDGTTFFVEIDVTPLRDAHGEVRRFLAVQREVTRRRADVEQLQVQAMHDHQTGLLNRRAVLRLLATQLASARRTDQPQPALLLIDVAGLRRINASLGRLAGDEVVRATGQRVQRAVGEGGVVGRLESGEFAVVTHDGDLPRLVGLCERIRRAVVPPVRTGAREIGVTVGLGLAVGSAGHAAEDVIREADLALRAAKARGPGQYELYDAAMGRAVARRLELEAELRTGLARAELDLHYQPIVHLDDQAVHHCEALLRWSRDGRTVASPAEFVPVAEDCGLIVPLGIRALHRAGARALEWQAHLPGIGVAVNLSPRQLGDPNLLSELDRLLESGMNPDLLTLEVTESALMDDPRTAGTTLLALRRRGVHLALDDFGTGYSSLAYLNRLPIDSVKVDKSFVDDVDTSSGSRAVIRAVVAMAEDAGLDVVVEGIETPLQCEIVRGLGVSLGQGYLFSRPVPYEQLVGSAVHP